MHFSLSIAEQDRSLVAGLLEGEACLTIGEQNGGQSYSCGVCVALRDDDQDLLEWLVALTGVGRLHRVPAYRTSRPQIAWRVDSQDDCAELLALVQDCGFHGRRAAELRIWRCAVHTWTRAQGEQRRAHLLALKRELQASRRSQAGARAATPFAGSDQFLGYLSGFVCAEGSFYISRMRPGFSVHLRQDDKPLLQLLSSMTGLGGVYEHRCPPPLNPACLWTVTAREELEQLIELLRNGGLVGRKRDEMEGLLSALVYTRWRRGRAGAPTRNTIAREFGTWHRALEAAGLAHRAARRPPGPMGGAATRARRREAQRAKVVAAVQRFAEQHGRLPRAMEFFRWRLAYAADTPTQGTVYKVFPGGWESVLAACETGVR